ncbi:hypothetical protein PILCRDRAFT_723712 [Piloderma croceum F 1598]|uniref:Uncharacterized protein n=1 Tax=Piloderma croceum (strain F 1598) TaxID=765440 RepID=A0A0C3AIK4_PILCF|nr:hypothetical protein PILCRDRAFT_723712 [Piloderma croceum F 1598]
MIMDVRDIVQNKNISRRLILGDYRLPTFAQQQKNLVTNNLSYIDRSHPDFPLVSVRRNGTETLTSSHSNFEQEGCYQLAVLKSSVSINAAIKKGMRFCRIARAAYVAGGLADISISKLVVSFDHLIAHQPSKLSCSR